MNSKGKQSAPFYFWDNKPHECSQTWQVVRSEFDHMMLNNAREHGVQAHEGVRVMDVLFEGDRAVGVTIKTEDGSDSGSSGEGRRGCQRPDRTSAESFAAARLGSGSQQGRDLDLLGRRVSRYRKRRRRDDRDSDGQQERMVLVHPAAQQHRQRGCRCALRLPVQRPRGVLPKPIDEEVELCPSVKERVSPAKRVAGYFATKDYSYRATRIAGDGWVMIGDAFGFLDPLYSSGVLLALKSGEFAADAIAEGLRSGDTSGAQLGKWEDHFNKGVDRMRRLVCEYYDGFSFGGFVKNFPDLQGTVTDVLIGDVFDGHVDKLWSPMESLYEPGRSPIPPWNAGLPAEQSPEKANELVLPEDRSVVVKADPKQ